MLVSFCPIHLQHAALAVCFSVTGMRNNETVTKQMLSRCYCVVKENLMVLFCILSCTVFFRTGTFSFILHTMLRYADISFCLIAL